MRIQEDIKPISYFKAHSAEVLEQINKTHRPFYVTQNGEAKAVVLAPETFEEMNNAIKILKIVSMSEQDIREGRVLTQTNVENQLKKKFCIK
ncbi:MAG TPA: type II toxin-antitoxin system Phd/YefM family antitoxin [Turneriella sp.]|nr:type II toxin-antitoxin system Phd/YefM family antitoxin [Turneriella sp.]